MTTPELQKLAYIQNEVSRICHLVEIQEWIIEPRTGLEGLYTPQAQKLFNKLAIQENYNQLIQEQEHADIEEQRHAWCEEETDRICNLRGIIQWLRLPTKTARGLYTDKAQMIFDDLWESAQ
tara:strand:+ start:1542 stop:1907 length:366 start_codon:yes stop_codon:yes gene_type:complete